MTTLNPSHNPFSSEKPRHAQAVHRPAYPDDPLAGSDNDDDLSIDGDMDPEEKAVVKARREGRRRVRNQMPPMPDLRFEQSYLLSIRPFLTPHPTKQDVSERGPVQGEGSGGGHVSHSLVESTENDEVFHWGREVDVQWGMVAWVTFRDQLLSPLLQGALWGWAGLAFSASSIYLRQALYPASHISRGRVVGGSGGSIRQAGGGDAVGDTDGWWRKWVKSFGGGVEVAAA